MQNSSSDFMQRVLKAILGLRDSIFLSYQSINKNFLQRIIISQLSAKELHIYRHTKRKRIKKKYKDIALKRFNKKLKGLR